VLRWTLNLRPPASEGAAYRRARIRGEDGHGTTWAKDPCGLLEQDVRIGDVLDQVEHRERVELAVCESGVLEPSLSDVNPQFVARIGGSPRVQVEPPGVPAAVPRRSHHEAGPCSHVEQAARCHQPLDVLEDALELLGDLLAVGEVVAIPVEGPASRRTEALVHEVGLARVLRADRGRWFLEEQAEAAGAAPKRMP
jgi:hypothetical protein